MKKSEFTTVCFNCGKPLTYKPHPLALLPFFCEAVYVNGRQTGCYVKWWAKLAKDRLK